VVQKRTGVARLDSFTEQLDRIVEDFTTDGSPDARAIVTAAKPYFAQLVSDMSWLDDRYLKPDREDDDTTHMLAKAPDESWTVVATIFPPRFSTPIHDHVIWGLVGVGHGVERESRYRRLDDGSQPGHAELEFTGEAENLPGAVMHIIPPEEEIHLIHNPTDEPSCSIHVYGGDLDRTLRHKFDLERNTVEDYLSTYTVTC
jgi:predicted metal-dependent enzyme (double-stranded beta helix superfamily)